MPSLYHLSSVIASFFIIANTAIASLIPSHVPTDVRGKHKARALDFYVNCSKDQKKKLDRGFKDAATLARWTSEHPIDLSRSAYTHYLRPEDKDQAQGLWDTIKQNDAPNNALFHFTVRCGTNGPECPPGSLAITDATPRSYPEIAQMLICPYFFTAPETAKFLDSKQFIKNPKRTDNSWCQPGQKFSDLETAGHTLLHEMTHLDAVGAAAKLSVRDKTHGTDDVGGLGDRYQPAARALKDLWDKGSPGEGVLKPVENAENSAAAATEWYFLDNCGFQEVLASNGLFAITTCFIC